MMDIELPTCAECGDPIAQSVFDGKWKHYDGPSLTPPTAGLTGRWIYLHEAVPK